MNHILILIALIFFASSINAQSLGTWTQMKDFPDNKRENAVAFAIGDTAYVGTGWDNTNETKADFYGWDSKTNSWFTVANLPGTARTDAIAFTIGRFGYVGTGLIGAPDYYAKDFWKYNPKTNTWTQVASMPDGRYGAVAFVVNNKAYVGTGKNTNYLNDFWEFDPGANTWTQVTSLPSTARNKSFSFSIGNKGYVGTGGEDFLAQHKDFWEYNTITNSWTQLSDFPENAMGLGIGFSIGDYGYAGTGWESAGQNGFKQYWHQYNPANDSWTKMADISGVGRHHTASFVIENTGYVALGHTFTTGFTKELWGYTPDSTYWPAKTNITTIKTEKELVIFPNPSNGKFFINSEFEIKKIQVYNQLGQIVFNEVNLQNGVLDLNLIKSGIYFVEFEFNDGEVTLQTIVKE